MEMQQEPARQEPLSEPGLESRILARQWFEEMWNKDRPELLETLMASDARGVLEGEVVGREAFRQFMPVFRATFSDYQVEVEQVLCEGAECAVRWVLSGTHDGDGLGVPPTGRAVRIRGTTWMTFRNGQLVSGFDTWNQGALMHMLGAPEQVACNNGMLPD